MICAYIHFNDTPKNMTNLNTVVFDWVEMEEEVVKQFLSCLAIIAERNYANKIIPYLSEQAMLEMHHQFS